ncbi:acyl-CoA dehydrogenase family protein [Streptomyces sp. NPDC020792]|uniref:acyl-CoA dehydrogenase family protein n=1 Tax=Streptomyces sp. NPDC020792 TaxID=3365089 RepID=UPI00378D6718
MRRREFFWPADSDLAALTSSAEAAVAAAEPGAVITPENPVWRTWQEMGFDRIGTPEHAGGVGGTLLHVTAVEMTLAYRPVSLPALPILFLAGVLLRRCGRPVEAGALPVLAPVNLPLCHGDRVDGRATDVPWPGGYDRLVVPVATDTGTWRIALVDTADATVSVARNVAGEQRARVRFDGSPAVLLPGEWAAASYREVLCRNALTSAAALTGALVGARDLTLRHAVERRQFDRRLADFPVVRHYLAEIAEEASAALAAVRRAALSDDADDAFAARFRAGSAASVVARLAHQVHGAMGTSLEYPLGHFTRRLWAWSEEPARQDDWALFLGERIAVRTDDREDLWSTTAPLRAPS